jgi:adenine-specific DNA-methyltransferase
MRNLIMNESKEIEYSKSELIDEINKLRQRKKYGLVWEEEEEDVVLKCRDELPVLKEVTEREMHNAQQKDYNIIIEGDNFHSISVLNYTHPSSIDVIYIDPPFNTGARDWKYNNDYVDINNAYRHSKWLSMMAVRLKVAKNLLKEDGVFICAIDENEVNHLGVLLEEIFLDHEIHLITIVHNPRGQQGNNFSYVNEFAYFVFRKDLKVIGPRKIEDSEVDWRTLRDSGSESMRTDAKNCFYPIYVKNDEIIGFGEVLDNNKHPYEQTELVDGVYHIWPIDSKGNERKWRYARQSVESVKGMLKPKWKRDRYDIIIGKNFGTVRTVWDDSRFDASEYGTKMLQDLVPNFKFDYPKSLFTVYDCLAPVISSKKDAVVLDYFAGSGTTGHAVMLLNKEDGGNRKFILCTNNENQIAERACFARIEKSISGHEDWQDVTYFDENVKYFKTDFVDATPTDYNKRKLTNLAADMLCLKESCFVKIKEGEFYKVFKGLNGKTMCVIFDDDGVEEARDVIREFNRKTILYIFSLDEGGKEDEFKELENLVEIKPVPASILNVYRRIFK